MTTSNAIDSGAWSTIEPRYIALRDEDLKPDLIPAWLERWSDLEKAVLEERAVRKRAMYLDVTDARAEQAFHAYAREVMAPSRSANQTLISKLLAVPGYEPAPAHVQMMRRWRNEADLKSREDASLQAEITALEREYDEIASSPLDDQEPVRSVLREDETNVGREVRWRAERARWLQHREPLNQLFLKLLALRRRLAHNAGLPDYRAYRWRELNLLDYSPQDVVVSHDAVAAEIVPVVTRWRVLRQQQHGVAFLKPWDASIESEPRLPLRSYADMRDLVDGVARMVAHVDSKFGDLFNRLRDGFLRADVDPKKASVNEEFLFPQSGCPCIFVSPRGTFEDVAALLHESGHAFHDVVSQAYQSLWWNVGGPYEFCEFAANAMIMVADTYLERERGGFYSAADAGRARTALMVRWFSYYLPDQMAEDAFQHWVYADAPEDVCPSDLDAAWLALSRRFKPDEDWNGLEIERMTSWQQQGSLFTRPLITSYYSLAQLGAVQVWHNAQADHAAAVKALREALALSGTRPSPELYGIAGVRWPFDRDVVADVARFIAPYFDHETVPQGDRT